MSQNKAATKVPEMPPLLAQIMQGAPTMDEYLREMAPRARIVHPPREPDNPASPAKEAT